MHLKHQINLTKIWLKGLNSHIFKDERLNWSKILKID